MRIYMIHKCGTDDFYCDRPQQWWRQEFADSWWGAHGLGDVLRVFAGLHNKDVCEIVAFDLKFNYVLPKE
ncbi:hypothetical protein LCGC14_2537560 [marine sediment metagenome]|uniref:Uncharacterized protein n=1 Tax=marine sediment metagenome TaxID=412755 RepID=A0A0F9AS66_9ZZZZ